MCALVPVPNPWPRANVGSQIVGSQQMCVRPDPNPRLGVTLGPQTASSHQVCACSRPNPCSGLMWVCCLHTPCNCALFLDPNPCIRAIVSPDPNPWLRLYADSHMYAPCKCALVLDPNLWLVQIVGSQTIGFMHVRVCFLTQMCGPALLLAI